MRDAGLPGSIHLGETGLKSVLSYVTSGDKHAELFLGIWLRFSNSVASSTKSAPSAIPSTLPFDCRRRESGASPSSRTTHRCRGRQFLLYEHEVFGLRSPRALQHSSRTPPIMVCACRASPMRAVPPIMDVD